MTPLDAWVNTANILRLRGQLLDPALAPVAALLAVRLSEEEANQAARRARVLARTTHHPKASTPAAVRKPVTAALNASGRSMFAACPAPSITTFFAPGILAAM